MSDEPNENSSRQIHEVALRVSEISNKSRKSKGKMNMDMEAPAPTLIPDDTNRVLFPEKVSPILANQEDKMKTSTIKHQIDDIQKSEDVAKKEKSKKNKQNTWLPNFCTCCGNRKETQNLVQTNEKITNKNYKDQAKEFSFMDTKDSSGVKSNKDAITNRYK